MGTSLRLCKELPNAAPFAGIISRASCHFDHGPIDYPTDHHVDHLCGHHGLVDSGMADRDDRVVVAGKGAVAGRVGSPTDGAVLELVHY